MTIDWKTLEIVCAHNWGDPFVFIKHNDKNEAVQATWRKCRRCEAVHYSDRDIPRVVIARLEAPPNTTH